jgi:hypothetical protein
MRYIENVGSITDYLGNIGRRISSAIRNPENRYAIGSSAALTVPVTVSVLALVLGYNQGLHGAMTLAVGTGQFGVAAKLMGKL